MKPRQYSETNVLQNSVVVVSQNYLTATNPECSWKVPPVNRREVFCRDNHTRQYCGSTKRLTLDPVRHPHLGQRGSSLQTVQLQKGRSHPSRGENAAVSKT